MTQLDAPKEEAVPASVALFGLVAGPAVFLVLLLSPAPAGLSATGWSVAAVAALMAIWWLTQAIPIAATALLPALLFPVLGVGSLKTATAGYAHPLIFLFLGGFVVALAIERWNLHRRIAIAVIGFTGAGGGRLIAGFMMATAGLSMWVSNTATTLMMVPIALSVVSMVAYPDSAAPPEAAGRFARGLLLSVAYAASIGGLATLIGTPPNAFLAGYMDQTYGVEIGFVEWMLVGVPISAAMLAAAWFLLARLFCRPAGLATDDIASAIGRQRAALGRMSRAERLTAILFAAVALMWMLQPLIEKAVPVSDAGIALAAAIAAFVIPVNLRERVFLMDWEHARKLPWGILILFGGGLSLADAIASSGLADWLGARLAGAGALSLVVVLILAVALVVFLTELTSNTATAAVFVPVAATLAASLGIAPMVLAVPTALAASCAFMMPVATPPNAIVFAAGRLTVMHMCAAGIVLNLAGIAVIVAAALYLVPLVFPAG